MAGPVQNKVKSTEPRRKNQGRLDKIREAANPQVKISDSIQTSDLLRFKGSDLGKVNQKIIPTSLQGIERRLKKEKVTNQPKPL